MSNVVWADGPFSILPAWVLDSEVSDRAIRLFGILARHAQADGHGATPGRKRLAEKLRCSTSSVDRARDELIAVGAVSTRERRREDGSRTTDEYVLHSSPREAPLLMGDEGGVVTGDEAKNESPVELERPSRAARSTKPNIVWDSLVEVTGFDPKTTSEKADFGKTVRELRAIIPADATAEDVAKSMRARRRAWEREYPDAAFTHRVLRGKWAELEALARRLLSPSDQRGEEIPERMTPEEFRAWRSTASRQAIADYQHRYDVDDSGEPMDGAF